MNIKSILVSQPEPKTDKNPFSDLAERFSLKVDFRSFIHVEGVDPQDFRQQRVNLANYTAGLRVIDIINIEQKSFTETGYFDTHIDDHTHNIIHQNSPRWSDPGDHTGAKGDEIEAFNGAWSVYPFFNSENIIISDINSGLFIVKKKAN